MNKINLLCLGNPQVPGDALGPMVGTLLEDRMVSTRLNIVGTYDEPVTRTTYSSMLTKLLPDATTIVIDAAVSPGRVGDIVFKRGTMIPGESIVADFPAIGDYTIKVYTADSVPELFSCSQSRLYYLARRTIDRLIDLLEILHFK